MTVRLAVAAATASAALALAGCAAATAGAGATSPSAGGSTAAPAATSPAAASSSPADNSRLPPARLVAAALAAVRGARTFHLTADGTSDGQPLRIDMRYGPDDSTGSVTIGGARIDLLEAAGTVYFRAPEDYWRAQVGTRSGATDAAVLAALGGRWVLAPRGNKDFADLVSFADRAGFLDSMAGGSAGHHYGAAAGRTVDGVATLGVRDATDGSLLYVARTGTPYPVLVVDGTAADGGVTTFGDWDEPVTVYPPAPSAVIDLSRTK